MTKRDTHYRRWWLARAHVTAAIAIMWALLAAPGPVLADPQALLIEVQLSPSAYHETKLPEKLQAAFSRNLDYRVRVFDPQTPDGAPPVPQDRMHADSLMNWGMEVGGRYLLSVTIERTVLERRKTFSIPLLFHRYQTIGSMVGELRLLDLAKGRVLAAEPIKVEVPARQQFQGEFDDNRHDPSLRIPAPAKSRFFSRLEDEVVSHLIERVQKTTKGR